MKPDDSKRQAVVNSVKEKIKEKIPEKVTEKVSQIDENNKDVRVVKKLIWSLVPSQASSALFGLINGTANGIIVGKFFGCDALAAMGFVGPLTTLVGAFSSLLFSSSSVLCGKAIGSGKKDEIQRVFNTTLFSSMFFVAIVTFIFLAFSRPLAILLGTTGADTDNTAMYILGLGIGTGFSVLATCLNTFLQLERMDKMFSFMSAIMMFFNVGGNLINILFFHWGLFGIGLFASIGNVICVLIALPYILVKGKLFTLSIKDFDFKKLAEMVRMGSPSSVRSLAYVVQSRVINQFIYMLGGTAGMAAMAIAGSSCQFMSLLHSGCYGNISSTVSSLLVGQRDVKTLRKFTKIMVSYIAPFFTVCYIIFVLMLGEPIVLLFGADAAELPLYVNTFRIFALFYFADMFLTPITGIYQAMGKVGLINITTVFGSAVVPVVLAFGFGKLLGYYFIVAFPSFVILGILLGFTVYNIIKTHRIPLPWNICHIPDSLAVAPEDSIVVTFSTVDEVVEVSKQVVEFCKSKGLSAKTAYYCGLCIEEMAVDTIVNRFKSQRATIDLRLFYENDHVRIMLRDSCQHFDPNEWLELCTPEDASRSLGIRMVSKLAGEMNYVNSLGLNVLIIEDYKQR